jgi:hypothetical protein
VKQFALVGGTEHRGTRSGAQPRRSGLSKPISWMENGYLHKSVEEFLFGAVSGEP